MSAQRGIWLALFDRVSTDTTLPKLFHRTSRLASRGLFWSFLLSTLARAESLTVTVPQGLSTIANPFNYESNVVSQLLTNVPEGTQLYKFDAARQRWLVNQFQFGAWVGREQTLAPGEGAFIRNPTNPFSITFTGIPPTNFVVSVRSGNNLLSVPTDGTTQLVPLEDDVIRLWDWTQTNYTLTLIFYQGMWYSPVSGFPQDPPLRAGESFFYSRSPSPGESVPQLLQS